MRRGWLAFLGAFWPFILGALLVAGGVAAIVLGYLGVSGTVVVGLQLPYLVSGALLGLALVIVGSALLIAQILARQARLTSRLIQELRTASSAAAGDGGGGNGVVVAVKGGRWYHRPGCLLVQGKDVRRLRPGTQPARRLSPCRVCDPPPTASG